MRRFLVVLGCLAAGCVSQAASRSSLARPTSLPNGVDLIAVAPLNSDVFVYIDVARIRESGMYPTIERSFDAWASGLSEAEPAPSASNGSNNTSRRHASHETREVGAWIRRIDWLFCAASAESIETGGVWFVSGRIDEELARELLVDSSSLSSIPTGMTGGFLGATSMLNARNGDAPDSVVPREIAGHRGFVSANGVAVELSEGLWLMGSPADVDGVLSRWDHPATWSTRSRFAHQIGLFDHQIAITVEDAAAVRGVAGGGESSWIEHVESMGLWVDLSDGIEGSLVVQLESGLNSAPIAAEVQREVTELAELPVVRLFGVDSIFEQMVFRVDEERLWMSVRLDALESRDLWGRVSGAVSSVVFVAEIFRGVGDRLGSFESEERGLDDVELMSVIVVNPNMATVRDREGFAGGAIDVHGLSSECFGFIGASMHVLEVSESTSVRVLAHAEGRPVSVAIALDDGRWICSQGAVLEYAIPVGSHRVYVASPVRDSVSEYVLAVTTDARVSVDDVASRIELSSGAARRLEMRRDTAGGEVDLATLGVPGCQGFLSDFPVASFDVVGAISPMRILVRAPNPVTLVVRGPDDVIRCYQSSSAGIEITQSMDIGVHDVWVAAPSAGARIPFVLGWTEHRGARARDLPAR